MSKNFISKLGIRLTEKDFFLKIVCLPSQMALKSSSNLFWIAEYFVFHKKVSKVLVLLYTNFV